MNVILMGPPGVGKGTQSRRLATALEVPIVASGDMFRKVRQDDTPLAHEVRNFMDRGEYVPDDLTIEMVLRRLHERDVRSGFILDGFPRTVPQAGALDETLRAESRHVDHVVLLDAPMDVVLKRLSGRWLCGKCARVYNEVSNPPKVGGICDMCGGTLYQRSDEAPEVQRYRLEVYVRETAPVLEYYREGGRLETVDAEAKPSAVTQELKRLMQRTAAV